jgi:CoA:oxalate CoA-transferase
MQGNPVKLSAYADPATRGPAPDLDGDRDAILAWLASKA